MTELGPILSRLGLEQYLESFVEEGFDTWEVVLDITESDLDALGVRLGHRRKLQREIANTRGCNVERLLTSPTRSVEDSRGFGADGKADIDQSTSKSHSAISGKRKYKRHPKPDENAPERPPSAYVIFSNKMREELRPQNLSFTEIAKRVGESWQILLAEDREPYESQASAAKEKYHAEMIKYKKTDEYAEYSRYLAEFKSKTAPVSDGKKPRLEKEASVASSGSTGSQHEIPEVLSSSMAPLPEHGPLSPFSRGNEHSSPSNVAVAMAPPLLYANHSPALGSDSLDSVSPPVTHRGETAEVSTFRGPSKIRSSNEHHFDGSSDTMKGFSLPRIVPLESCDSRMPLNDNNTFVNDPKVLRSHNSPPDNLRRPHRPSVALLHHNASTSSNSSSGISSNLSSGIPTPASAYTPITSVEDSRSQRPLQSLQTPGLKALASSSNTDTIGQSKQGSPSTQPSSLPPAPQDSSSASLSSPVMLPERALHHQSLSRESPKHQSRPSLRDQTQVSPGRKLTQDDSADPFPVSRADPLSVLAYAGRMVDRGDR